MFKSEGRLSSYESGLFHFACQISINGFLLGFPVIKKIFPALEGNIGREALFVKLLFNTTNISPAWQGHACSDIHASLDRYVLPVGASSPLSYFFTHWHITFEYLPTQKVENIELEKIVMHAYINRHGVIVNFSAHKSFKDNRKESMVVDENLKQFIQEQVNIFAVDFIELFLQEKNNAYFYLQEQFENISNLLTIDYQSFQDSSFLGAALKTSCIEKVNNLLTIVENINRHDEFKSDKRDVYLRQYLAFLESCDSRVSLKESENMVFSTEISQENQHLGEMFSDSVMLGEKQEPSPKTGVDDISTILDRLRVFENKKDESSSINSFVRKHYKKLMDFFKEMVESGKIDEVTFLYSFLSNVKHKPMQEIFIFFLDFLESCHGDTLASNLVVIGDFFYEHSEIYRATVFKKNSQRYEQLHHKDFGEVRSESLLWQLFKQNKLHAFRMFLRQGIRPISQYTRCRFRAIEFSLPSAIVFSFREAPYLGFIEALKEFGSLDERELSDIQFYFSSSRELDEDNVGMLLNLRKSACVVSPFSLAMRCAVNKRNYPFEIVQYFSQYVGFEVIVSELPDLFNYDDFKFVIRPFGMSAQKPNEISMFSTLNELQKTVRKTCVTEGLHSRVFFCQELDLRRQTMEFLLNRVAKDFSGFDVEKQRAIILALKRHICERIDRRAEEANVILVLTHFLDSLLVSPEKSDYLIRMELLCLRIQIEINLQNKDLAVQACYQVAQVIKYFSDKIECDQPFFDIVSAVYPKLLDVSEALKKLKTLYNLCGSFVRQRDLDKVKEYHLKLFDEFGLLKDSLTAEKDILSVGCMLSCWSLSQLKDEVSKSAVAPNISSNRSTLYASEKLAESTTNNAMKAPDA